MSLTAAILAAPPIPAALHPPRREKISTSIFERFCTISRPRIASTALAKVLGREIERLCTILLVEIFGSGGPRRLGCGGRTYVRYWRVGFNNPSWTWSELEAALSGRARARDATRWGSVATGGRRGRRRGTPVATGRRGAATASRSNRRPSWCARPAPCRTPSCTATPTSRSSTGRRTPRSWPPRPPASASRRWRSPTTTASTASSASPRRPAPSACRRCSAPRSRSPPASTPRRGSSSTRTDHGHPDRHRPTPPTATRPIPHGHHLVVLADGPDRLRPPVAHAQPRPPRRGEGGAAVHARRRRRRPRRPRLGAHRLPQGRRAGGAARATARPPPAASCSGWSRRSGATGCWSSCGTTATRSTRPATTPSPRSPPRWAWTASPPTTSTTPRPPSAAWPPPSPPCGPDAASPSSTRGCRRPPAPTSAPGPSSCAASRRYPGVVERAAEIGRAAAFDLSLVAPSLPPFPCPERVGRDAVPAPARRGRRPAGATAPARAGHGMRRRPGRQGVGHRSTTSWRSSRQLGFAGYFLVVWDLVEFCRRSDIFCQGRGAAANSAVCYALGITAADAVSLGLLFERFLSPERDGPPDIDIDIESDRREEVIQYVYDTPRPPPHRAGRQRHHLPRPLGGARHGQGARPRAGPAGRLVEAGRRLGHRRHHRAATPGHDIPEPVLDLAAAGRGRAAPPRHPLRRDGDLRPPGDRGVPGRVGADGRARGAAVGQGRLRRRRAGEVRPARPRDALGAALRRRPRPRAPRLRDRPRHHPAGRRGVRDALPRRHGRRVPDRVAGPDGDAAAAAAAHVLRPRGRGGADPPRPDPGRFGAPVHPPAQPAGAGHLPPPAAREGAGARRSACRCSRSS